MHSASWAPRTCQRLPAVEPCRLLPALHWQPQHFPKRRHLWQDSVGAAVGAGTFGLAQEACHSYRNMVLKKVHFKLQVPYSFSAISRSTCRSYARCSSPGLGCSCVHRWHMTTASSWALVAQIHCLQELSPGAQQLPGYRPVSSEGKQGDLGLDLVLPQGWSSFSWASPTVACPKASAEAPSCGGWQGVRAHRAQAAIGGAGTSGVLPYSRNGVPQIRVSFFLHLDFSLNYRSGVGFPSVTLFPEKQNHVPLSSGHRE